MSINEKLVGELMSALADLILSGNSKRIREIHSLVLSPGLTPRAKSPEPQKAKATLKIGTSNARVEKLRVEIEGFETREALSIFLKNEFDSKNKLLTVSRALKVQTNKSDSYENIAEKIIDATVGYKLRSRAIRGHHQLSFDGGPDPKEE